MGGIAPHLGEIWVFENLEIFGWVHGPRHLAARVYNAHWQSFIHMGACKYGNTHAYIHNTL